MVVVYLEIVLPESSNLGFLLDENLHIYKSFEQLKKFIKLLQKKVILYSKKIKEKT